MLSMDNVFTQKSFKVSSQGISNSGREVDFTTELKVDGIAVSRL